MPTISTRRNVLSWARGLLLLLLGIGVIGCSGSKEAATPAWKSAEGYQLQLRMEPGQSYRMETTMDQTMTMNVMGRTMDMEQEQTMFYRYDVTDVADDGGVQFDYTMTRAKGRVGMPAMGRTMTFDTADSTSGGQTGRMSQRMRAVTGHTVAVTMSPNGTIRDVQGLEAIIEGAVAAQEDSMQARMMRRMLSREGVLQQMSMSFNVYPDGPVQVGDTWSTESTVRFGFPMDMTATYTLSSIKEETAVLDAQYKLRPPADGESMRMGGMKMDMDLKGTMEGTVEVDLPTGLATQSDLSMDLSGEATISGQRTPMGQSMTMDIQTTGEVSSSIAPSGDR